MLAKYGTAPLTSTGKCASTPRSATDASYIRTVWQIGHAVASQRPEPVAGLATRGGFTRSGRRHNAMDLVAQDTYTGARLRRDTVRESLAPLPARRFIVATQIGPPR